MINFRGDVTDVSAETATLVQVQKLSDSINNDTRLRLARATERIAVLEAELEAAIQQAGVEAEETASRHANELQLLQARAVQNAEVVAHMKTEYRKVYGKYKQLRNENHEVSLMCRVLCRANLNTETENTL